MIQIDLSGRVILITGALGAIAENMVKRLSAAGATLVLLDLKPEKEAKEALSAWEVPDKGYVYHSVDLTDSSKLTRAVDESFDRFPHLDTVLGQCRRLWTSPLRHNF
jgi:NAD(P)-dependent dehydrogenase (short-subunit alcohol dehydrogenase family)